MRFVKSFLVGIIVLFIVITIMSLLIPSNVKVSRSIIVNAPFSKVYSQVSDLKHWKNWHPAFSDSVSTITFSTPSDKVNAYCDIIHNGSKAHLQLVHIDSFSIKFLLQPENDNEIETEIAITSLQDYEAVQVDWKALNKLSWYPWDKFYAIFIDKISGPGYDAALNGLKHFVETHP